jgi:hypothetical protein
MLQRSRPDSVIGLEALVHVVSELCLCGLLRPSRVTVPRAGVSVVTAAKRENHHAFVIRSPVMLWSAWLSTLIEAA